MNKTEARAMEKIKGFNNEKEILSDTLACLLGGNRAIALRSSIEKRLSEIDKELREL